MHLYKLLMGHALQPAAKEVLLAVDDDSSVPYSCREARVSRCVRRCEGRCQTSILRKGRERGIYFPRTHLLFRSTEMPCRGFVGCRCSQPLSPEDSMYNTAAVPVPEFDRGLLEKIEDTRVFWLPLSPTYLAYNSCSDGQTHTQCSPSICFPRIAVLIAFAIPRDRSYRASCTR